MAIVWVPTVGVSVGQVTVAVWGVLVEVIR